MAVCAACGQENPEGFKFCGACGASLQEAAATRAERKVVTVLFADLVGFTSRPEQLDPEDVRNAYTHLRGAQAGDPGVDLQQAIAAFKKMGATAYLAETEQLLKATA